MNTTCKDCGTQVHPVVICACGQSAWGHDSLADALNCPGTGIHVEAAA